MPIQRFDQRPGIRQVELKAGGIDQQKRVAVSPQMHGIGSDPVGVIGRLPVAEP